MRNAHGTALRRYWLVGPCLLAGMLAGCKDSGKPPPSPPTRFQVDSPQALRSLTFSPNGGRVFGAKGQSVTAWDSTSGAEVASFPQNAPIVALAVAPDGQ